VARDELNNYFELSSYS